MKPIANTLKNAPNRAFLHCRINAEQMTATGGTPEKLRPPVKQEFLMDLLVTDRVPPGVDDAAYVKAGFSRRHRPWRNRLCPLVDQDQGR